MFLISVQSGSNGNCLYVEAGGTRLLFDAGISGSSAEQRLAAHGVDIRTVDALVISHDHCDHSRSLGVFQRKFGLTAYLTRRTLAGARRRSALGDLGPIRHFQAGETLRIGEVTIETIPTPHDGDDPVAFVVDDGRHRLGILTDLGNVFDALRSAVASLDAVLVESNYDPRMLAESSYTESLKRRIRGPHGHLSNAEAATLLAEAGTKRLCWACLGHLSEHSNRHDVAMNTHRRIVGRRLPLWIASRCEVSEKMEI